MTKRPIYEPGAGARIARESAAPPRRPKGDDGHLPELNALDAQFFGVARTNLQIPTADAAVLMRVMKFLEEEWPKLRQELLKLPTPRARSLEARTTFTRWNQAFSRMCGVSCAPKTRGRRKRSRQTQSDSVASSLSQDALP